MNPHLELIWDKIDGSLDKEGQLLFDELIQSDRAFASLYQQKLNLEKNLRKKPFLDKAPENLLSNVMNHIKPSPSIVEKDTSFSGFKIIGLVLALTTFILTVFIVVNNNMINGGSNALIADYFNKFQSALSLPEELMQYLPYSMALLAGIGLVWLDKFYRETQNKIRLG